MEEKTPPGSVIFVSVAITGKQVIGKLIASPDGTATPLSLVMKESMGQKTSCIFLGFDFILDSVAYLSQFYGQCEMKSIFVFNEDDKGVLIRSIEAEHISGQNPRVLTPECLT